VQIVASTVGRKWVPTGWIGKTLIAEQCREFVRPIPQPNPVCTRAEIHHSEGGANPERSQF